MKIAGSKENKTTERTDLDKQIIQGQKGTFKNVTKHPRRP